MIKTFFKITGGLLVVLLIGAFAIPFLFKGKLLTVAKTEINGNILAKADFSDLDISLFRHFPSLAVGLEDFRLTGKDEFEGDTLFSVGSLDLSVNLMSVIRGDEIRVDAIELNQPRIHAIVNRDGKANWDIMIPDSSADVPATKKGTFRMVLKKYAVHGGFISYRDERSRLSSEISDLEHEGSGDFTADQFTLKTNTTAGSVDVTFGGIAYLNQVRANITADITVDAKTGKYSFQTEQIGLNELNMTSKGYVQLVNDSVYTMDIAFGAPSADFKSILSFVPVIYKKDFASIKTSGTAAVNGFVRGTYSVESMPAYQLNLAVANGFFQYPDLPQPVKNINLAVKIDNPDGVTDHTTINVSKGHIELNNNPFDFRLLVKNPVSDLYVDAAAKGKLDLAGIPKFVKLEEGTRLSGLLNADLALKGRTHAIQKQQYDQFTASGDLGLTNFLYVSKDYPAGVKLSQLLLSFNPRNVTISKAEGSYQKTNFSANGFVHNLLSYVINNEPLDGKISVKADKLNLNELMGVQTDTAAAKSIVTAPFVVPANLHLTLNAEADAVHYDKLDITGLSGIVQVYDETIHLTQVEGNALDGRIAVSGTYTTKIDKKKPDIAFAYNVKGVDVQKTFYAFNTVQKLVPIGRFLAGKLTSQLSIKGKLGEYMMPELSSLTGNGNVLLLEGVLNKFKPVESLAQALNVTTLNTISVKDLKSYFEFSNGKVMVKPFNLKVKDIDMEIGGLHGLDQSLDYLLNLRIPRALMGERGNSLVNNLVSQATAKGMPLAIGDKVDLKVNIGGTIQHPKIRTGLKQAGESLAQGLKQQATDFARAKADSVKNQVKTAVGDTVASVKKKMLDGVKGELTKKLTGTTDSNSTARPGITKKGLEETGKGLLNGVNPFKKKKKEKSEDPF